MWNTRLVPGQANSAPNSVPIVNASNVETSNKPMVHGAARMISSRTWPG
jgi:hypothetical protein